MTKQELCSLVSNETGIVYEAVKIIVDEYARQVIRCLEKGNNYTQRGFGTFHLVRRKEKKSRDIGRNLSLTVPERTIPKFRPSPAFTKIVKQSNN